jgi:hypothetical protein
LKDDDDDGDDDDDDDDEYTVKKDEGSVLLQGPHQYAYTYIYKSSRIGYNFSTT